MHLLALVMVLAGGIAVTALQGAATAPSSSPEGLELAARLRQQQPPDELEVRGLIRIRDADGRRRTTPFRYQIQIGKGRWAGIYTALDAGDRPAERLTVIHQADQPVQYELTRWDPATGAVTAETRLATGDAAMTPFSGSDFWLADLGLDFLHWPEQRIVEDARIKMRKGRACKVLESRNPAAKAGYTRVRSWIDSETGNPIIAEAYDSRGQVLKEFEIGSVTKVDGVWQLKNLEMRNTQDDTLTILEFQFSRKDDPASPGGG